MHQRLTLAIILLISFCHINGAAADSVKSYLWGLIQFRPKQEIGYEPGYWKDQILFRREFHEPVTFLPAEVRYGIFIYGGGKDDNVSSLVLMEAMLMHVLDINWISILLN